MGKLRLTPTMKAPRPMMPRVTPRRRRRMGRTKRTREPRGGSRDAFKRGKRIRRPWRMTSDVRRNSWRRKKPKRRSVWRRKDATRRKNWKERGRKKKRRKRESPKKRKRKRSGWKRRRRRNEKE